MTSLSRLSALERCAARHAPDELVQRARRITDLLGVAYRRKHRHALPYDTRRAWLAELSTDEGMQRLEQALEALQRAEH